MKTKTPSSGKPSEAQQLLEVLYKKGQSKLEIARALDVSISAIYRWETRKDCTPHKKLLTRLQKLANGEVLLNQQGPTIGTRALSMISINLEIDLLNLNAEILKKVRAAKAILETLERLAAEHQ